MIDVDAYVKEVTQPEDEETEFELLLETCAYRIERAVGRGKGRRRWIPEAGMERLPDEGVQLIFDAVTQGLREVLALNRLLHGAQERGLYQGTHRGLRLVTSEDIGNEPGGET